MPAIQLEADSRLRFVVNCGARQLAFSEANRMRPLTSVSAFIFAAAVVASSLLAAISAVAQELPTRVVSINVCTDQLAMLIADEGQLHSVSHLASDPAASVLAQEAEVYVRNHGQAEEIFLMRPDLILAGTYTTRTTVDLLRRLGFRVEEFPPETSLDEVSANIRRMGRILGHEQRAERLVAELDRGLAELRATNVPERTVGLYSSNSYTSGSGTLAGSVVDAVGLRNIAVEVGIIGSARLPLEMLVFADPDIVVSGDRHYERPALAQENFSHPAYGTLTEGKPSLSVPDKYWICGAPFTLEAARILHAAARDARGEAR